MDSAKIKIIIRNIFMLRIFFTSHNNTVLVKWTVIDKTTVIQQKHNKKYFEILR
jgi:hypothetical protein